MYIVQYNNSSTLDLYYRCLRLFSPIIFENAISLQKREYFRRIYCKSIKKFVYLARDAGVSLCVDRDIVKASYKNSITDRVKGVRFLLLTICKKFQCGNMFLPHQKSCCMAEGYGAYLLLVVEIL